jgi:hypothetical protein
MGHEQHATQLFRTHSIVFMHRLIKIQSVVRLLGIQVLTRSNLTGRRERGRGANSLIYTGPEGKPGGESQLTLSLKTDGVLKIQSYPKKKKRKKKDRSPGRAGPADRPIVARRLSFTRLCLEL